MTCHHVGGAIICRPDFTRLRAVKYCPTCERRRRFAGLAQEWYGTIWTCCSCGDAWEDGERLPRPFVRAWRQEYAAKAKRDWEQGVDIKTYCDSLKRSRAES